MPVPFHPNEDKSYLKNYYDYNYDDIFFRAVSLGVISELNDRIYWVNKFSDGHVLVKVPFYYSLAGDENFNKDAYLDDVPGEMRLNGNVDQIPRVGVHPSSWTIASSEFTNPDIRVMGQIDEQGVLKRVTGKLKSIPYDLEFSLEAHLDSEGDAMKYSEQFARELWPFRFFNFQYKQFLVSGVMNVPDGKSIEVNRSKSQTSDDRPKITHSVSVKTYQPVLTDINPANKGKMRSISLNVYNMNNSISSDPDADISGPLKRRSDFKPDDYYRKQKQLTELEKLRRCKR